MWSIKGQEVYDKNHGVCVSYYLLFLQILKPIHYFCFLRNYKFTSVFMIFPALPLINLSFIVDQYIGTEQYMN